MKTEFPIRSTGSCEDLSFYPLGAGVTVTDRRREVDGDYMRVAHIHDDGNVTFYASLSQEQIDAIQKFAERS